MKDDWLTNLSDLNPLNYRVWGVMLLKCISNTLENLKNFTLFKTLLDSIWSELPEEVIDHAILAFHNRLTAFVEVNG